jgi:hypothetical protein
MHGVFVLAIQGKTNFKAQFKSTQVGSDRVDGWTTSIHHCTSNHHPRKSNKNTLKIASESIHSIKHMTNLNKEG